jgi:hypothetical protein
VKRGLDRASAHGRGENRGGAPEGERADRKARAASADAAPVLRLSALRLPSFYFGGGLQTVRADNSDATAS